jgi:hypothetical protein
METSKQKVIISFDIGIKNLACCVVAPREKADKEAGIVMWYIISLAAPKEKIPPINELAGRLFGELDELVETLGDGVLIDTVLIENQPSRLNGAMKSIQSMIYSYFQLRKHWEGCVGNVTLVSAKGKLAGHDWCEGAIPTTDKTGYELNKWKAVRIAEKYIEGDAKLQGIFCSYNKKDDMSDSLLQCIAWLRKQKYSIEKCVIAGRAYETI